MIYSSEISDMMSGAYSSLATPVMIILLCIFAFTLVMAGSLIAEIFTTRRHLKVWAPRLLDEMQDKDVQLTDVIQKSGLLKNQKKILLEVTEHKRMSTVMREAIMIRLLDERKAHYDGIVKISVLMMWLGLMIGLLGTLLQVGPIISARGEEDAATVLQSLPAAFDAIILGLVIAAICLVIFMIRKRWYANDMSILATLMKCALEVTNGAEEEPIAEKEDSKQAMPFAEKQQSEQEIPVLKQQPDQEPVTMRSQQVLQSFMPPGQSEVKEEPLKAQLSEKVQTEQPLQVFLPPEDSGTDQPLRVFLPSEESEPNQPLRVFLPSDNAPVEQETKADQSEQMPREIKYEQPVQEPQQSEKAEVLQYKLPAEFSFMPEEEQQKILRELGAE